MPSIFEKLYRMGPASLLFKAIIVAIVLDALLLAFILLRRTYRKWYFKKRDARVYEFRQRWHALISGEIPFETWRKKPFDRRIVEEIALDAFEAAGPEESARLLKFLRNSGLIEKRIFEARNHKGWRRLRALVALGRTRAPEGIHALAEGLRDSDLETRLASLRGLARTASPKAAEEILAWLGEAKLTVPELPLQSALVQCCAERPQLLIPFVRNAQGPLREVLGRVLGEVATPSLGPDLLQFAGDKLDELRASVARAMSHSNSELSLNVLIDLAQDRTWFVRLRAIVSLGKQSDDRAIPVLVHGLTDSNRLVRLRGAEALVGLNTETASIFEQVVALQDRYGLHAYLTALENAGLRGRLESRLRDDARLSQAQKDHLFAVLQAGGLRVSEPATIEATPKSAAGLL